MADVPTRLASGAENATSQSHTNRASVVRDTQGPPARRRRRKERGVETPKALDARNSWLGGVRMALAGHF